MMTRMIRTLPLRFRHARRAAFRAPLTALTALAMFAAALALASALGGVPTVAAQTSPVGVGVVVEPDSVTVGEVFTITLSAQHPPEYHVVFPKLPGRTADGFEIKSQRPIAAADNGDGTLTSSVVIEAALFRVGEHSTPALSVGARAPDGEVVYRPARPVSINVESILDAGADALGGQEAIPLIAPPSEMSAPPIWPWFAGGAAVAALAAFAARRYWRGRAPPPAPLGAPAEIALAELDRIETLNLPASGDFPRHYALVSDCVRSFLSAQFGVPTMERATSEIAAEFQGADVIPQAESRAAIAVLEESDLVKFARLSPQPDEAREALAASRRTVRGLSAHAPSPPSADGDGGGESESGGDGEYGGGGERWAANYDSPSPTAGGGAGGGAR